MPLHHSLRAQHMHALDVPGHGCRAPFAQGLPPPHAHLAPVHHPLDGAEHRLNRLLAQHCTVLTLTAVAVWSFCRARQWPAAS